MGWTKGTIVMEAKPYAHVVMQKYREERCNFCLKSADGMKKCAACKKLWYCGVSCQKRDWKLHKVECPVMKRVPHTPTDSMRLYLRLVVRFLNGSADMRHIQEESPCIRTFLDLMSHSEEVKNDATRRELFTIASDFLRAYTHGLLQLPPDSVLLDIFGKMVINTFTIADESLQDVGVAIYNSPSILDHRCCPNAVASFDGRGVIIRAVADIEGDSYDQVFLSYVDPLATRVERQDQLSSQYYFNCHCTRCNSQELEMMMTSVAGGSEDDLARTKLCLDQVESMLKSEEQPQAILDLCNKCLLEVRLPATNVHLVQLTGKAFDAAVATQQWKMALHLGITNLQPYQQLHPPYSPSVGYLLANLGKLMLFVGRLSDARLHLVKGLEIFSIALGPSHYLFQQVQELLLQCDAEIRAAKS